VGNYAPLVKGITAHAGSCSVLIQIGL
jgi:hypothetical protein